ncbi:MAG: aminoacyl-histidine dipeptidase [bacterium]|nr:aminoacyl-histidine dipeptidase [bacterium]
MADVLSSIDYKKVFHFFEEISNVPRGSRNNKGISDYLVQFAKDRGLYYEQDEMLNVIIIKDATPGYEDHDAVMLQGHMDMVCIKNPDSDHDFEKDPLKLSIDGDFIKAEGTTLGGDDGVAIAYGLAILDSNEFEHPRLEVVITTDEEIGLLGAAALDVKNLQAKNMINIDSEEEDNILVGCAGGMTAISEFDVKSEMVTGVKVTCQVRGLQGGHSGVDIKKHRTNATILSARMMNDLQKEFEFSVASFESGEKDNAIPSLSNIEFVVEEDRVEAFTAKIAALNAVYEGELKTTEPDFKVATTVQEAGSYECLTKASFDTMILYILFQPNGIQTMSADIEGLVESSLNLGICKVDTTKALYSYSVRSSVATYKTFMSDKIKLLTENLGGTYRIEGEYPGWEYKHDSKLREVFIDLYKEEFGRDPIIEVIHAGLECGILANKIPGLDIVSIGPDMHDVHTPKERLSISSTIRVFDYIVNVLKAI